MPVYMYKPESVLENDMDKILWKFDSVRRLFRFYGISTFVKWFLL